MMTKMMMITITAIIFLRMRMLFIIKVPSRPSSQLPSPSKGHARRFAQESYEQEGNARLPSPSKGPARHSGQEPGYQIQQTRHSGQEMQFPWHPASDKMGASGCLSDMSGGQTGGFVGQSVGFVGQSEGFVGQSGGFTGQSGSFIGQSWRLGEGNWEARRLGESGASPQLDWGQFGGEHSDWHSGGQPGKPSEEAAISPYGVSGSGGFGGDAQGGFGTHAFAQRPVTSGGYFDGYTPSDRYTPSPGEYAAGFGGDARGGFGGEARDGFRGDARGGFGEDARQQQFDCYIPATRQQLYRGDESAGTIYVNVYILEYYADVDKANHEGVTAVMMFQSPPPPHPLCPPCHHHARTHAQPPLLVPGMAAGYEQTHPGHEHASQIDGTQSMHEQQAYENGQQQSPRQFVSNFKHCLPPRTLEQLQKQQQQQQQPPQQKQQD
ncbi:hypothetical protein T492DRAFT_846606 [Pavlovales sp. CCMP2436]|nr:hypothetical protein T492DRAFT_846606 [Pavlovales sp. CCMP2436]